MPRAGQTLGVSLGLAPLVPEDGRTQRDAATLCYLHSITRPVELWEEASNESRSASEPIISTVLGCPACQGTFRTWLQTGGAPEIRQLPQLCPAATLQFAFLPGFPISLHVSEHGPGFQHIVSKQFHPLLSPGSPISSFSPWFLLQLSKASKPESVYYWSISVN